MLSPLPSKPLPGLSQSLCLLVKEDMINGCLCQTTHLSTANPDGSYVIQTSVAMMATAHNLDSRIGLATSATLERDTKFTIFNLGAHGP